MDKDKLNQNIIDDLEMAAKKAALATEGVYSMTSCGSASDIAATIAGMDENIIGVKASNTKTGLVIEVFVEILYGYKIPEISWNLQENIKKAVNNISDTFIREININIQGVNTGVENK